MLLCDVNVLVYAAREDAPRHAEYRAWLLSVIDGPARFGVSELVLSGLLRVTTHPRLNRVPSRLRDVFAFIDDLRDAPGCTLVEPGPKHWSIFEELCRTLRLQGNLIPDAWLAAMAIEGGHEWVTTDRDFARFPGLRWRHPLGP